MATRWEIEGFSGTDRDGWLVAVVFPREKYRVTVEYELSEDKQSWNPVALQASRRESVVSPRDVRRLPLDSVIKAGAAYLDLGLVNLRTLTIPGAREPFAARRKRAGLEKAHKDAQARLTKAMMPRGRPQRGYSTKFYADLLAEARRLTAKGISPAKEIARKKGVEENLVHQWLHRARKLDSQAKENP